MINKTFNKLENNKNDLKNKENLKGNSKQIVTPNITIFNKLSNLIKTQNKYINSDKKILRNILIDDAEKEDEDLIKLLLLDNDIKKIFFKKISNIYIFKKKNFIDIINSYEFVNNSYTKYCERIGLVDRTGAFLADKNDIVLQFPHKDCLLEGGQTKEEQKYNEVFYNEILAENEIQRLLEPKVFCNVKKYSKEGIGDLFPLKEETPEKFDIEKDNLLIKGNNLISLYSILKNFEGKIKCIYIDPPYNTGGDSFKYNDNFNHSTWLTFIKNRIEISKKILSKDGIFFIHCSFHEYAYLKVLMDEIFGLKNFKMTINIQVRHPDRILTGDKEYNDIIEYILVYSKNPEYKLPKFEEAKLVDEYVYSIKEKSDGKKISLGNKEVFIFLPNEYEIQKGKANDKNLKTQSIRGSIKEKNSSGRFYVKYLENLEKDFPAETLFKVENIGDDEKGYRYFSLPKKNKKNGFYFQGMPTSSKTTLKPYPNFLNFTEDYNMVNNEGGVEFRNGKKPEKLIKFIIENFSKKGDIVLDFFVGSGTTCAVAQKMNRKWIGIEQIDYGDNSSVVRMKNVLNGDFTGISKSVLWQGGGSFIYCELAKDKNFEYLEKIYKATEKNIDDLRDDIINNAMIRYEINDKEFINWGKNELTLEDKKRILQQIIDKNYMYINYSEMDDKKYSFVSKNDKNFTKSFYEDK